MLPGPGLAPLAGPRPEAFRWRYYLAALLAAECSYFLEGAPLRLEGAAATPASRATERRLRERLAEGLRAVPGHPERHRTRFLRQLMASRALAGVYDADHRGLRRVLERLDLLTDNAARTLQADRFSARERERLRLFAEGGPKHPGVSAALKVLARSLGLEGARDDQPIGRPPMSSSPGAPHAGRDGSDHTAPGARETTAAALAALELWERVEDEGREVAHRFLEASLAELRRRGWDEETFRTSLLAKLEGLAERHPADAVVALALDGARRYFTRAEPPPSRWGAILAWLAAPCDLAPVSSQRQR